jgi:hypothetical protein
LPFRLDLIGPEPDEPQATEILPLAPSRFYLTGFLVPLNAPASQKKDEDEQGELEQAAAAAGTDEDDSTREPPAARRGHFPSSIGVSVLVPPGVKELKVTARWGDYEPLEHEGKPTGEWKRTERTATVPVMIDAEHGLPASKPLAQSGGLEVVTSVRRVRGLEDRATSAPAARSATKANPPQTAERRRRSHRPRRKVVAAISTLAHFIRRSRRSS